MIFHFPFSIFQFSVFSFQFSVCQTGTLAATGRLPPFSAHFRQGFILHFAERPSSEMQNATG